jgi:hypothetical protein
LKHNLKNKPVTFPFPEEDDQTKLRKWFHGFEDELRQMRYAGPWLALEKGFDMEQRKAVYWLINEILGIED